MATVTLRPKNPDGSPIEGAFVTAELISHPDWVTSDMQSFAGTARARVFSGGVYRLTLRPNIGELAGSYYEVELASEHAKFTRNINIPSEGDFDLDDVAVAVAPVAPTTDTGTGAGLSPADRVKLDSIQTGAEVNVQSDWLESNSSADSFIQNKPDLSGIDSIRSDETLTGDGVATDLSVTNPFTSAEKTKLQNIAAGAEVNVQANWAQTSTSADDFIRNKPQIGTGGVTSVTTDATLTGDGVNTPLSVDNPFTAADERKLDGIEAGAEVNVQADWTQNSSSADSFIRNKPVIPAPITAIRTDSTITGNGISNELAVANPFTDADERKLDGIAEGAEVNVKPDWDATGGDAQILNKPSVISSSERTKLQGIQEGAEVNVQSDWSATSGDSFIRNKPNVITATERTKLQGIAAGAEVNVQSDWDATSGDSFIRNKPTISTPITSIRTDATIDGNGISSDLSVANPFTDADERKLDGISAGAEVNVQSDWNATSGDAFIQNKPTLGPQAPATAGQANKFLGVNASATALEYKDAPTGGTGGDGTPFTPNITQLTHVSVNGFAANNINSPHALGDATTGIFFGVSPTNGNTAVVYRYDVVDGVILTRETDFTAPDFSNNNAKSSFASYGNQLRFNWASAASSSRMLRISALGQNRISGDGTTYSTQSSTLPLHTRGFALAGSLVNPTAILFGGIVGTSYTNSFYRLQGTGTTTLNVTALSTTGASISGRVSPIMQGDDTEGLIGLGLANNYLNDFYRYTVSGNVVTLTSLTVSGTIAGLYGASSLGTATEGIIFGGETGEEAYSNNLYRYSVDTATNTITITQITYVGTISARHFASLTGDHRGDVMVIGGSALATALTDFYRLRLAAPAAGSGGGGDGIAAVSSDSTLSGLGTTDSPLGVANPFTDADERKLDSIAAGAEVNVQSDWNAAAGDAHILNKPNVITSAERTKLQGIAAGAEVNVNADWNAASGDAQILNKPSIPTPITSIRTDATITGNGITDELGVANPFTDADETKLDGIEIGAEVNVQPDWNATTGDGVILNKPTIPAAITSIRTDATITGNGITSELAVANPFTAADETKLDGIAAGANVNVNADWDATTGDARILNKPAIPAAITSVRTDSTINGDGISTDLSVANPFTAADETKLDGIAAGAEVNVQSDWTAASGDAAILNKPTLGPQAPATSGNADKFLGVNTAGTALEYKDAPQTGDSTGEENVQVDWDVTDTSSDQYILNKPTVITPAERTKLQGIQAGAEINVNADWDATTGDAQILNKPTIPAAITSIRTDGTINGNGITSDLSVANPFTSSEKTKLQGIAAGAEVNVNADWNASTGDAQILNKPTIPAAITSIRTDTTITGNGITSDLSVANPFTAADETKLDGIAAGAEVNVNADWDATSGDAQILNKPTIPAAITSIRTDTSIDGDGISSDLSVAQPVECVTRAEYDAIQTKDPDTLYAVTGDAPSGGGLSTVESDTTLTGDGSSDSPLSVANPFTAADETKLDGIAAGAEVNVQADWDAVSGDAAILNKPTIPTNTITAGERTKLQGIATGAEVNVNADWDATSGDAQILNKPTIPSAITSIRTDATITGNGISTDLSVANPFTAADETKLDGIAAGANVNVNADWDATSGDAQILNKPTIPAAITSIRTDTTIDGDGISSDLSVAQPVECVTRAEYDAIQTKDPDTLYAVTGDAPSGVFSQADRAKLDGIATGAEVNVNADWNATTGDAQILNKPTVISAAERTKLQGIAVGAQVNPTSILTDATITGNGVTTNLSVANPFTAADETKLDGIAAGAEVNVQPDWNATTGDGAILNKPTIPAAITSIRTDSTITGDGISTDLSVANPFTSAEKTKLAGVASGAEVNVNADWNATTGDAQILNKPTIPAAITSIRTDATITGNGITTDLSVANPFTAADETKLDGIAAGAEVNVQSDWDATTGDAFIQNKPTLGPQAPATSGQGDKFLGVNSSGTALEYKDAPTGGGTTTTINSYQGAWTVGGTYTAGDVVLFENNLFLTTSANTATTANAPYTSIGRSTTWKPISYTDFTGVGDSQSRPANDDRLIFYDQSDTNGIPVKYTTIGNVLNKLSIGATLTGDGVATELAVANPFTAADETKLDGIAAGANVNVNADWNATTGDAQILNKPTIPTNTITANERTKLQGIATGAEVNVNADWNATTGDAEILNKPTIPAAITSIRTDSTITGNGISTDLSVANPFTDADETKLDGIAAGAQVNVKPDWNAVAGNAQEILNKPIIMSDAERTKLQGIQTGAEVNVQADWEAASGDAAILNKPTIPTNTITANERTKLQGIATGAEVNVNADWDATSGDAQILNKPTIPTNTITDDERTKLQGIAAGAEVNVQADWDATSGDAQILNKPNIPLTALAVKDMTETGTAVERRVFGMVGDLNSALAFGGVSGAVKVNTFQLFTFSGNNVTITTPSVTGTIQKRELMSIAGDTETGLIYGGFDTAHLNDFVRYSRVGNVITVNTLTLTGSITAREGQGMIGDATSGFIFGGGRAVGGVTNEWWSYTATATAVTVTPMTVVGNITARRSMAITGTRERGIIFGGYLFSGTRYSDFFRYEVSGNNVTVTPLAKTGDAISDRSSMEMVGDEHKGFIYGGNGPSAVGNLGDAYEYTVSGNGVNVKALEKSGDTIPALAEYQMVGNATRSILFGGNVAGVAQNNFFSLSVTNSNFSSVISDSTLSGVGITGNPLSVANPSVCLTRAQYDALPVKDPNTIYFIMS